MPKIHLISDTHFHHRNIIAFDRRPWTTVEAMDVDLVDNWNRRVAPDDMVIHTGDVTGGHDPWTVLSALRGRIFIVPGNHDEHLVNLGAEGVRERSEGRIQLMPDIYRFTNVFGKNLVACHYALESWHHSHKNLPIHGHTHPSWDSDDKRRPGDGLSWVPGRYNIAMGVLFTGRPALEWEPKRLPSILQIHEELRQELYPGAQPDDLWSRVHQRMLEVMAYHEAGYEPEHRHVF